MSDESEYNEMKEKLPVIKQLFQTRHYIQCAALCERLLSRSTNERNHNIHKAYLNFYLALSHDTMAREAKMRDRQVELELAEKHYLAAIANLTPLEDERPEDIQEDQSPTSSQDETDLIRRRASDAASLHSDHSISTAATSIPEEDQSESGWPLPNKTVVSASAPLSANNDTTVNFKTTGRTLSRIDTCVDRQPPSQLRPKLAADLSSFINLVKSHLAGVRGLKDTPMGPSLRYSYSRSTSSGTSSRPASRNSTHDEAETEQRKWQRKSTSFRPRFDPTSVRRLCAEAIDEL